MYVDHPDLCDDITGFDLRGLRLPNAAVEALATAVGSCPQLTHVWLDHSHPSGDSGVVGLWRALAKSKVRMLSLDGFYFSATTSEALGKLFLSHSSSPLVELVVSDSSSDKGASGPAAILASALHTGGSPALQRVSFVVKGDGETSPSSKNNEKSTGSKHQDLEVIESELRSRWGTQMKKLGTGLWQHSAYDPEAAHILLDMSPKAVRSLPVQLADREALPPCGPATEGTLDDGSWIVKHKDGSEEAIGWDSSDYSSAWTRPAEIPKIDNNNQAGVLDFGDPIAKMWLPNKCRAVGVSFHAAFSGKRTAFCGDSNMRNTFNHVLIVAYEQGWQCREDRVLEMNKNLARLPRGENGTWYHYLALDNDPGAAAQRAQRERPVRPELGDCDQGPIGERGTRSYVAAGTTTCSHCAAQLLTCTRGTSPPALLEFLPIEHVGGRSFVTGQFNSTSTAVVGSYFSAEGGVPNGPDAVVFSAGHHDAVGSRAHTPDCHRTVLSRYAKDIKAYVGALSQYRNLKMLKNQRGPPGATTDRLPGHLASRDAHGGTPVFTRALDEHV